MTRGVLSSRRRASLAVRALVGALVVAVGLAPVPVQAFVTDSSTEALDSAAPTPPPPEPTVMVNRTVPRVDPVPTTLRFTARPTDANIRAARAFAEPLVPLGRTSPTENRALSKALVAFVDASGSDAVTRPLEQFLASFPQSAWRASLLGNLGTVLAADGAMSRALAAWDEAWQLAKDDTSVGGRAVADHAIGEWLDLQTKLGFVDAADARLAELGARVVTGAARTRVRWARERVAMMRAEPERGIAPGAFALAAVAEALAPAGQALEAYARAAATREKPRSLAALLALGKTWRLPLKAIRHVAGMPLKTPSVVQWKAGHVGALVAQDGDRVLVRDARAWGGRWIRRSTVETESRDAYLVPAVLSSSADAEMGAMALTAQYQSNCPPGAPDPDDPCPCDKGGAGQGMAVYWFHPVTAGLRVQDIPMGYTPPRGPDMHFLVRYNQDDQRLPQTPFYGNLGPQWSFAWLSFITEENTGGWVHVYLRGSGIEASVFRDANGVYPAHKRSRAVLVRTSASPIRYERRLPDGSIEVFAQADGPERVGRRIFLTEVRDPQGQSVTLTYDAQLRLIAATDALGQVTAFTYANPTDPLKITQVTDPYGRSATFEYDSAGRLTAITDVLGLTSRIAYEAGDVVNALTTPYGTTSFRHEGPGEYPFTRWAEATDPLGGTERIEYNYSETPGVAATAPASDVPAGVLVSNENLNRYNSYYWDKRAMALFPRDYTKAVVTHWLFGNTGRPTDPAPAISIPHSVKKPLESRIWYRYQGQVETVNGAQSEGIGAAPAVTARVLDDGATQAWLATYSAQGHVTSRTDPLGRRTNYTYAVNGIDLLEVRQTTGTLNELLASYSGYTNGHQPTTISDAAGQPTALTYTGTGQILTRTNAINEATTYTYDSSDRLSTITGPVTGATTTYTYDEYSRVRTVTDADGHTVTYDYDVLDRRIRTTYPDATYEETSYARLDPVRTRDRLGRLTHRTYDAVRRLVSTRDPAGRTIRQEWCICGSLDALTDGRGQRTSWLRDVQGRATTEVRPDGTTVTTFAYDLAGRLRTAIDPKLQVTTYTYAADNATLGMEFSNAAIATPSVNYSYDSAYARVTSMSDGIGTTSYTYHTVGSLGATQVSTVDGPIADDTISYSYDTLGRVVQRSLNGSANSLTYVYDALGRVTTETNVLGTFTYGYDGVTSRLASVAYPNGQTTSYSYLPVLQDGRLQTLHHKYPGGATLSKFDYTYDAVGNILTWQQQADGNAPVLWEYSYDPTDQLTRAVKRTTGATPTILKRYAWGYDLAGNRLYEQADDTVTGWTYDSLNRLATQYAGGTVRFAGNINEPAAVNIQGQPATVSPSGAFSGGAVVTNGPNVVTIEATDAAGNTTTASYQMAVGSTSQVFASDANGNLLSDGLRAFEWNARNQLAAIVKGESRTQIYYDGRGRDSRRVYTSNGTLESDRRTLWSTSERLEERTVGNPVTIRLAKTGFMSDQAHFFTFDHLGNIAEMVDGAVLADRAEYSPWGARAPSTSTSTATRGLAGHPVEDSLVFAPYRTYSPSLGRWLSEDPLGLRAGLNRYSYVGNKPIAYSDPLGLVEKRINVKDHKPMSDIDNICGTPTGGACTILSGVYALGSCSPVDGTPCTKWRAKMIFGVVGDVWVAIGPYPYKGRKPNDSTVVDSASARAHEWNVHLNPAIDAAVAVLAGVEAVLYDSKADCDAAVAKGKADAEDAFWRDWKSKRDF